MHPGKTPLCRQSIHHTEDLIKNYVKSLTPETLFIRMWNLYYIVLETQVDEEHLGTVFHPTVTDKKIIPSLRSVRHELVTMYG